MFITINEQEYLIVFVRSEKGTHTTGCQIIHKVSPNEEKVIGHGAAFLGYNDNPCRETGRQYALARAIEEANCSPEEKNLIINYYRTWGKKRKINYEIFWD